MSRYQLLRIGVHDNDNNIDITPANFVPWAAYQDWIKAGNIPDPYIPPADPVTTAESTERTRLAALRAERMALRTDAAIQAMTTKTDAEIVNWVNNTITDLASAKQVIRILARVVASLAKDQLS